ncbi:DUF4755 domain-containing protein [Parvibaculum sp.]|uniref:DUF4755 domain-containing protein n=1 Tax=Parvibaculum sp. TaxID=2024848 RepID=UPI002FDA740C
MFSLYEADEETMELFFIIVGVVAVAAIVISGNAKKKSADRVSGIVEKAFGGAAKYKFSGPDTGVAMPSDLKQILLVSPYSEKTYAVDQIRSHEIRDKEIVEQRRRERGNIVSDFRANQLEAEDRQRAKESFGLFVTVKDVDHPEWRVAIDSAVERKKWNEILNQARGI